MHYRIVETDNYGGDYPDEKFVNLPFMSLEKAKELAAVINRLCNPDGLGNRYWKVAPEDYELQPGFEP